ncbi:MAG: hypothetical protein HY744_33520 [Deltaproteobacteria bacterium]|nr:hypothetical protein [Deltaproteobacteria bacterium]
MTSLRLDPLPAADAKALAAAVRSVVDRQVETVAAPSVGPRSLPGRLPPSTRLCQGAEQFAAQSAEDVAAARYFGALLEVSYLVASADGLDAQERAGLAELIAQTTGRAVDPPALDLLFDRFERDLASEGREARIRSVATQFDDFMAREEALSFAALIAVADRTLASQEAEALLLLGGELGFSAGEVQAALDHVAQQLARALRAG